MNQKIKVGLVGFGYWGPNLARNFSSSDLYELEWICDVSPKRLDWAKKVYPRVRFTSDYHDLLKDAGLELVVVATPTKSHYEISKAGLLNQKHVLVEKPITTSFSQAEDLVVTAQRVGRVLAIDHPFLYSSPIRKLKQLIDSGEVGDIFLIDSERFNLGLIQQDINVFWDLAVHDLYTMDYLLGGANPLSLMADAESYTQSKQHEFGVVSLRYPDKKIVHVRVSWLSPVKTRRIILVGNKKMIYFDDIHPDEKIKIIDKGVTYDREKDTPFFPVYRWGDAVMPRIDAKEPLAQEIEELYLAIREGKKIPSLGKEGLRVIKILEAIDQSLVERKEVKLT